jgi:putative hemolysin
VRGVVYTKDLLAQCIDSRPFDAGAVMRPAVFVPENLSTLDTIERLREAHVDIAMVIDEHSSVQGILTVDDILKALVGCIPPAGEVQPRRAAQRKDGSWLLDGLLSIDEVKTVLELERLPHEDGAQYQTLGGLAMLCLGRIPAPGEAFVWSGWRFTVLKMAKLRVQQVLAEPLPGDANETDCMP